MTVNDYLARRDAEWMGPLYDMLGVKVGVLQNMQSFADKQIAYAGRRHLRHQLGVRLRLPARQHGGSLEEVVQRGHPFGIVDEVDNILIDEARTPLIISGAPEAAADYYRQFARLAPMMVGVPKSEAKTRLELQSEKDQEPEYDYEYDEKHKTVAADRARRREGREVPRRREPLPRRARQPRQPPDPGAEGRVALQARHRLRRDRRRGEDHRRVHRPHPRGPALVRGPAPGGRGQGGRRRSRRRTRRSPRSPPELLPHVRQARGHDRHGAHRGHRVHEDLRAPGGRDPDQPADGPRRPERPDLQDQGRQVGRGRGRDRGAPREGPAGARGHDLGRGLRAAVGRAEAARHQAHRC